MRLMALQALFFTSLPTKINYVSFVCVLPNLGVRLQTVAELTLVRWLVIRPFSSLARWATTSTAGLQALDCWRKESLSSRPDDQTYHGCHVGSHLVWVGSDFTLQNCRQKTSQPLFCHFLVEVATYIMELNWKFILFYSGPCWFTVHR
eukprot:scaffold185189_cov46-Prasinocladus_malaysianus.AAC.1